MAYYKFTTKETFNSNYVFRNVRIFQSKAKHLTWFDGRPAISCGWPSSLGVTWTTRYVTAPANTVNKLV